MCEQAGRQKDEIAGRETRPAGDRRIEGLAGRLGQQATEGWKGWQGH